MLCYDHQFGLVSSLALFAINAIIFEDYFMPSQFQMTSIFFNNILNRIRILCVTFHYGFVSSNCNIVIQIAFIIFFSIFQHLHTRCIFTRFVSLSKNILFEIETRRICSKIDEQRNFWLTNFCVYKSIFFRFNFILFPFEQGIFWSFHANFSFCKKYCIHIDSIIFCFSI